MSVMAIPITAFLRNQARELSDECMQNLKNKPNYTELEEQDRYYTGFLGELVFREYLEQYNKPYKHFMELDGESHGTDFILYYKKPITIDVKTSNKPYNNHLMMPKAQYNNARCDIYVGVKLVANTGLIQGFTSRSNLYILDIPQLPIPTMGIEYNELEDIYDL